MFLKNLLMRMERSYLKELQICQDQFTPGLPRQLNRQDFYLLYNVMTKVVVLEKFKKKLGDWLSCFSKKWLRKKLLSSKR